MNYNNVFEFWKNKVNKKHKHIEVNENSINSFFDTVFKDIDLENQSVLDYGCGGGYTGKYLFANKKIKKYIGVDILDESITAAKGLLKKEPSFFVKTTINDMLKVVPKSDVLVSIAVIQHFPDENILSGFLKQVNNKGFNKIIIQYRGEAENVFYPKDKRYSNYSSCIYACRTNEKYICSKLTKYKLVNVKNNVIKEGINILYFDKVKENDR